MESHVNLLTIKEAARLTKLHPNSIRNAIAQGRLEALRIGRNIRINEQDLMNMVTPYRGGEFGVWKKSAIGF
jgi:excisionase family DNA binding protein